MGENGWNENKMKFSFKYFTQSWSRTMYIGLPVHSLNVLFSVLSPYCFLSPPTPTILTQICRVECRPGVYGWEVGVWVLHVQYLWKDLQQQVQVDAAR